MGSLDKPDNDSTSTATNKSLQLSSSMVPHDEAIVFRSSSFFTSSSSRNLPTSTEVRAATDLIISRKSSIVVQFRSLNLIVKWRRGSIIPEGQCLWMIRTYLGAVVPVPEVYGWCKDHGESFLYMEMVRGDTLEQRWDTLSVSDRVAICDQLHCMVDALRRIEQDPADCFIGKAASSLLCQTG
jgi:hypothetical protein